jgi:polysaccharide export outer membrane protein
MMFATIASASAFADDYRLAVGDVLEVSAASVPEFRYRATVDVNGNVLFPFVGKIDAHNRSLSEVLATIQDIVPRKVMRRRGPDGSEHEVVIDSTEVSLTIAEYSPVYLNGDVSKPGSYPYRPGMTVLQAIALAGGYDILRTQIENPHLLIADMRGERETLLNEYVRLHARITRLQTELGRQDEAAEFPGYSSTAAEIRALETEQLDSRQADFEKEKRHLASSVKSLSYSLDLLQKQMQTEQERARMDQDELDRVEELFGKGMVTITRLTDVKRLILLSASRASEIEAKTEQRRQEREEAQRKLQKLLDQRRIELLRELQDTKVLLAATTSKLSTTAQKMLYVGAVRSQIGRGGSAAPEITILRKAGSNLERLAATEGTELLPNDVVGVILSLEVGQASGVMPPTAEKRVEAIQGGNAAPSGSP